MKRFLFLIILLLSFFFINPALTSAQTPAPFNNSITVPGFNCGKAEDLANNQCCHVYYPTSFVPPDLGPLGVVYDLFSFISNNFLQSFVQPLIFTAQDLAGITIQACETGVPSEADVNSPACKCINPITPSPSYLYALNQLCQRQSTVNEKNACLSCANEGGVWSGAGCIYTDAKQFIQNTVFGWGIGLAGGFALLCIIYAAFMMQSSQGNPEQLKKAQEMLTSCIMGLMLIIFSVFILRLIGISILGIPGFS